MYIQAGPYKARCIDASRRCLSAALANPHQAGEAYSNLDRTRAGLRYCDALSTWQCRCPLAEVGSGERAVARSPSLVWGVWGLCPHAENFSKINVKIAYFSAFCNLKWSLLQWCITGRRWTTTTYLQTFGTILITSSTNFYLIKLITFYNLRPRCHSFSLTVKTDDRNYINRMLFKDIY